MAWIFFAVAIYAVIGLAWGGFLNALTTPNGQTSWQAVLHGVFWPISMLSLLR